MFYSFQTPQPTAANCNQLLNTSQGHNLPKASTFLQSMGNKTYQSLDSPGRCCRLRLINASWNSVELHLIRNPLKSPFAIPQFYALGYDSAFLPFSTRSPPTPSKPKRPMRSGVKSGKLKGPRQSCSSHTRLIQLGNSLWAGMKRQAATLINPACQAQRCGCNTPRCSHI